MNILIVEDEELAVKKLKKTLFSLDKSTTIVGETDSIESTIEWFNENPSPDLVLMDIELSDGQSFEIFNQVKIDSPVIFITSYDEYALKAFKVNSIDYLLKPVQKEDLEAALNKYEEFKKTFNQNNGAPDMATIIKELQQQLHIKDYRKRFLVKQGQKLVSVEVDDIAYFYSDGRLIFFKTTDNRKFIVDYTLDEVNNMLNPDDFFRISRSFLISVNSVLQIHDYFGNRLMLTLKPESSKESIVSREKVSEFKSWLGK
jgi:two-component system, LytTR family, response regulator LytT